MCDGLIYLAQQVMFDSLICLAIQACVTKQFATGVTGNKSNNNDNSNSKTRHVYISYKLPEKFTGHV